ncbi:MAG: S-layer homology domain-containing protein, partial [Bacillota bacterium]
MKKALTILLAVAMMFCFSATAFAADFNDTDKSSDVAKDAINKVAALGIVEGYEDGGFHPTATITRAEFAKMADIAAGLKDAAEDLQGADSQFKDVKANVWYTGWINLASAQGYVKGYENGTYGPNNTITYAEVTTVLMRLLGYNDNLTGPWPINYINQATKLDVLDDVENFSANVAATRSDVAIMLAETLDQNMVKWVSDDNEFVEKEKNDETYTLLQDSFDGATVQGYVTGVNVIDAEAYEYQVSIESDDYDCDIDTAVAGVDPYMLA